MSKHPLVRFTKALLDFMFFGGIIVVATVPFSFSFVGRYYSLFKSYYLPFCLIFMSAGAVAVLILGELRRMFKTVIKEDPFVTSNVTSLKKMGVYAFIISAIMTVRLFIIVTPAALVLVAVFLIAGLFSMVLAMVFDQAVTYKQENDLTI